MAKYRIWDGQLNRYAFQETIFNTKNEAINQLISFFSVDLDELTKIRKSLWQDSEFAELYIEKVI